MNNPHALCATLTDSIRAHVGIISYLIVVSRVARRRPERARRLLLHRPEVLRIVQPQDLAVGRCRNVGH